MFIIGVYDIKESRVNKIRKIFDRYLNRVQKSVYEGELKDSKFKEFKSEIDKVINKKEDSVIFYTMASKKYVRNEILGISNDNSNIL